MKSQQNPGYINGYKFADTNYRKTDYSFIYKFLMKTILYRTISTSICLIPLLSTEKRERSGSEGVVLAVLYENCIISIIDLPVLINEMNKNRLEKLNKNVINYLNSAKYDQSYKKAFVNGVNRYIEDSKRR